MSSSASHISHKVGFTSSKLRVDVFYGVAEKELEACFARAPEKHNFYSLGSLNIARFSGAQCALPLHPTPERSGKMRGHFGYKHFAPQEQRTDVLAG